MINTLIAYILFILPLTATCQYIQRQQNFEELYIHTDKSIYTPGEDLWFKAYFLDDVYHTPTDISKLLYINIVDFEGNNIISEIFSIQNGFSNGNLQLSDTIRKGEYQIVAFTENMMNLPPSFWYRTEIVINPSPIDLWKISYYPELSKLFENILAGEVICTSSSGFPITGAKIQFSLETEDKKLHSATIKTDTLGKANINWDISKENRNKNIVLNIDASYLNKNKSIKVNIPIGNKGINVKFYPESGSFIQGLQNQVAFKVTDNYGSQLNISGTIVNQNGDTLKKVKTLHEGIGIFSFIPKSNELYYLKLDKTELGDSMYALPKASESGYILSLKETQEFITTFIVNMTSDLKGKKVKLSVSNGWQYENIFESVLENEKRFPFLSSSLPVGIATLTLFSDDEPVAERLVFLNKHKKLNLYIETKKEIYDPREKVELTIKATDFEGKPATANLSLTVSEKSKVIGNKTDIASYLLLESKLKNVSGDLSYYLQENEKADSALNLLLMTHGWRKIDRIEEYSKLIINTENMPGIRGSVYTKKNKAAKKAQVQILDTKTWQIISTETNDKGRFFIPMEDFIAIAGSQSLSISAAIPNRSKDLVISIDPNINDTIFYKFQQAENILLAYNLPQKVKIAKKDPTVEYTDFEKTSEFIEEVMVTEKKYDPIYDEARKSTYKVYEKDAEELHTNFISTPTISPIGLAGSKFQDHSILELIRPVAPSFEVINGTIVFRGRNSITRSYVTGALFVVNGVPMGSDITNMAWVNPINVKEVKVITSPGAALKYGSNCKGLIEITMLEGNENVFKQVKVTKEENISIIKGFKINKEFYVPDYSIEINDQEKSFDARSTLYWNPNLDIDNSGEKIITFFNGDKRTFFRCNVVGTNKQGLLGSSKLDFRVN
jgi:hypothetical protein